MGLIEIEESDLKEMAQASGHGGFAKALEIGAEWKKAGCEPMYVIDQEDDGTIKFIKATAREVFCKRLH